MGDVWEKWKRGELNYYDKFNTWKDEKTLSNRKEFEKKYRPRIIATRKAERKKFAKMESESSEYTLGKKTLLGT